MNYGKGETYAKNRTFVKNVWTNEIMPIKQGAPVMITLFCGFGYTVLLFVGFMLLPGWMLGFLGYMSCFAGANLLLSAPIYLWLRKQGVARFSAL